jgi:hypothetical protein
VVDATLIAALSSTKNASGERDPEMHQTKKGNQWYFGMKAHIGVDADSGLVHTVKGTAANSRRCSRCRICGWRAEPCSYWTAEQVLWPKADIPGARAGLQHAPTRHHSPDHFEAAHRPKQRGIH